jgi:hypothetical protein
VGASENIEFIFSYLIHVLNGYSSPSSADVVNE